MNEVEDFPLLYRYSYEKEGILKIEISDEGIGMSEEDMKNLF